VAEQAYAYVTLIPVAKGFQSAVAKEMGGVGNIGKKAGMQAGGKFKGSFGGALKGIAAVAGTALAGIGIGKFFSGAVDQANDLSESLNAVSVAYGEASGDIAKLGEDAATRLGVTQASFNAAAVRFSAFAGRVVGEGGDVGEFVDDVTTRAADFASVFNIDVSEALQVFQSGLSGEAEPLKRFGINLLDSEVKAYALQEGLIGVGEQMSEDIKTQARYGLLMQETAKTAGDFANTSDGLANSQRILQASFAQMQAEVGGAVLPVLAELSQAMLPLITDMGPMLTEIMEGLAPVITQIVQELPSFLQALMPIIPILLDLAIILLDLIVQLLPVFTALLEFMLPIIEFLAQLIGDVLVTAFDYLKDAFTSTGVEIDSFGSFFQATFSLLASFFADWVNNLIGGFETFVNFMIQGVNAIIDALNSISIDVPGWVTALTGMDSFGFNISRMAQISLPRVALAEGGMVSQPTNALIGEAGPEVVMPLDRFESMMGLGQKDQQPINYYAAPNKSLDAEQELLLAMRRVRVFS
tara:strand:- start:1226 stop:2803 length:1578 start_codon:yes stop_codon:yes gene_type:complete